MHLHKRILVLDTSAILAGFQSSLPGTDSYVTQLVLSEAKRKLGQEHRDDTLDIGSLFIMEPSLENVGYIMTKASEMGETANLSPVDISVLALARQLSADSPGSVAILTDDYSIQNLASALGIDSHSLATKKISTEISWVYYCKGCRRTYRKVPKGALCKYCGSEIIRKPVRKRSIRKEDNR